MVALIKLALLLGALVYALHRKVSLSYALPGAALALGLLFGFGWREFADQVALTVTDRSALNMAGALVLIGYLEYLMRTEGMLAHLVETLRDRLKNPRLIMAAGPALVGILPSPGGARFSAPLVEQVSPGGSPEHNLEKGFINYWFRHPWEWMSPLYPGTLLAMELTRIPLGDFIVLMLPFFGLYLLFGALFLGPKTAEEQEAAAVEGSFPWKEFALSLWPLVFLVGLVVVGNLALSVALLITLGALAAARRISLERLKETLRRGTHWHLVIFVMGLFLFKNILEASGAPVAIADFLKGEGIPTLWVIILLPLILALSTGVNQAFVSLSMPILLALTQDPYWLAVGYAAGFTGVMLSPVHLCILLTADYFRIDFLRLYWKVLLPGVLTLLLGSMFWLFVM